MNFNIENTAPAWFQLDGEPEQIAIYSKPAVLKILEENNVLVGKQSASTTEVQQPCDVGNCFKGTKKKLKGINDNCVKVNAIMMDRNKALIEKHNDYLKYNSICNTEPADNVGSSTNVANTTTTEASSSLLSSKKRKKTKQQAVFNPAHAKMAITGLLRVQAALQNTMKPEMIRESFSKAGVYPYSLSQILNNCSTKLSSNEEQNIVTQMNDLTNKMKKQGEIFETDFDMCHIMSSHQDNSKKARDELVIYRRRSCILTHPSLLNRESEKLQKKTDDAAEAAEKRDEKKRKAVEKATKKAEASKTAKKPRAK